MIRNVESHRRGSREPGLLQRLRRALNALEPRPGRIVVGYSGGADSLALLALLADLARLGEVGVHGVHIDHGVRPTSRSESEVAKATAAAVGVQLTVRRLDASRVAGHVGLGREEALRRERYAAFAQVIEETGADLLALAHHQRDQAETVLLHLLRGAGLRGASGMRERSLILVPWWEERSAGPRWRVTVWRPFLLEPVETVQGYARKLGLPIVEDETNDDTSLRRNAIRHAVLPLLEDVSPGATANLAKFAALAGDADDELEAQAGRSLGNVLDGNSLNREALVRLSPAISGRVVRLWLENGAPAGLEVSSNRIEEVLRVANGNGRRRIVEIGSGLSVIVDANTLSVKLSGNFEPPVR